MSDRYVIQSENPQEIQLKPIEQSHQTNKKMKQFNISEDEMDRMLHIARQAQDLDLIEKLKAKQGFYSEDSRRKKGFAAIPAKRFLLPQSP